jgi:hypothetical protein
VSLFISDVPEQSVIYTLYDVRIEGSQEEEEEVAEQKWRRIPKSEDIPKRRRFFIIGHHNH